MTLTGFLLSVKTKWPRNYPKPFSKGELTEPLSVVDQVKDNQFYYLLSSRKSTVGSSRWNFREKTRAWLSNESGGTGRLSWWSVAVCGAANGLFQMTFPALQVFPRQRAGSRSSIIANVLVLTADARKKSHSVRITNRSEISLLGVR